VGPWLGKKRAPETVEKMRAAKTGVSLPSTQGANHWNYRGDEVTYSGIHFRARRDLRGLPCTHVDDGTCQGSMTMALNHDAPKEFLRVQDGGIQDGFVYSVRVEDYIPMCKSHHVRYDVGGTKELIPT